VKRLIASIALFVPIVALAQSTTNNDDSCDIGPVSVVDTGAIIIGPAGGTPVCPPGFTAPIGRPPCAGNGTNLNP
jgi:hypothetical protein